MSKCAQPDAMTNARVAQVKNSNIATVRSSSSVMMVNTLLKLGRRAIKMRRLRQNIEFSRLFAQEPDRARILVHIGKCGGGTISQTMRGSKLAPVMRKIHRRRPPINPNYKYCISLRNPLSRAVSAYNWRKKLCVVDMTRPPRNEDERRALVLFKNVNDIAESLYSTNGVPNLTAHKLFGSVRHINDGIPYYLNRILALNNPDQIDFVFLQEFLDQDIQTYFNIELENSKHDNGHSTWREHLSDFGAQNMRKFLVDDYKIIGQLFAWGKISPERMERLLD